MNVAMDVNGTSMDIEAGTDQYLTFMLAEEEYGVDILRVQEIRGWDSATIIPNAPDYVLGVVNLRGVVVPIFDLRKRFHLEKAEFNSETVTVVVKVQHAKGERTIGMVVDAVSDVYNIPTDSINSAPEVGGSVSMDFIKGLATVNDQMIILLNVDELVNVGVLGEILQESASN
ncbi:MAG: chemotaxis protein CheW [Gammaproteobacteria bacterium]|nr:chemotaxis protein CheW [Gammaproteobacteria bacterium]